MSKIPPRDQAVSTVCTGPTVNTDGRLTVRELLAVTTQARVLLEHIPAAASTCAENLMYRNVLVEHVEEICHRLARRYIQLTVSVYEWSSVRTIQGKCKENWKHTWVCLRVSPTTLRSTSMKSCKFYLIGSKPRKYELCWRQHAGQWWTVIDMNADEEVWLGGDVKWTLVDAVKIEL